MRLYWHLPLPGPFGIGGRIGGPHVKRPPRPRWRHAIYWWSGLAFCELAFWAGVAALWLVAAFTWASVLGVTALVTRSTEPFRLWRKLPVPFKTPRNAGNDVRNTR
jgi:hypothetical protein